MSMPANTEPNRKPTMLMLIETESVGDSHYA